MKKVKRRILNCVVSSIIAVVTVTSFVGCGKNNSSDSNSNGKNELKGTLIVTSYGGTYDEAFKECVVKPFEEKYPGAKINLVPYTGIAKLENGGGSDIDIVSLDDFDIIDAGNKDLFDNLKPEEFSNWNDLYEQSLLKNTNGDVVGLTVGFGTWGIAYNPEKIDKPNSWKVFWDSKVKGSSAMMSQFIPDIIMTQKMVNASDDNMDPVWKAYEELTPSIAQYYSSFSAPESLFESGSISVASWFDGRAIALKESGKSIDFTVPSEGGVLIRDGEAIMSTSKNKELAREFINFRLNPEIQANFAKKQYYGPTNKKAKLDDEISKIGITYGEERVSKLTVPDWNKLLPQRKEWLTKWTEVTSK